MERAASVFGNITAGSEWLNIPNESLNEQTPLSLLDTDLGTESVLDMLGRIAHGVFA